MWPYESETDAIEDVLRLARGMTYKCAACGAFYILAEQRIASVGQAKRLAISGQMRIV